MTGKLKMIALRLIQFWFIKRFFKLLFVLLIGFILILVVIIAAIA